MSSFSKLRVLLGLTKGLNRRQRAVLETAGKKFLEEQGNGSFTSIELHDSEISEITSEGLTLIVKFDPAYVHKTEEHLGQLKKHEGWLMPAELLLANGKIVTGTQREGEVSTGHLECEDNVIDNVIPVPLVDPRPVKFFIWFRSGEKVEIDASSIEIRFTGAGKFLEKVPRGIVFKG